MPKYANPICRRKKVEEVSLSWLSHHQRLSLVVVDLSLSNDDVGQILLPVVRLV